MGRRPSPHLKFIGGPVPLSFRSWLDPMKTIHLSTIVDPTTFSKCDDTAIDPAQNCTRTIYAYSTHSELEERGENRH